MALRLTGKSLLPDAPAAPAGGVSPSASGANFAPALAAHARALLARGDLDGYRKQFTGLDDHADPHARYYARVLLIEAALVAAGQADSRAATTQLLAVVAQSALEALEQEPREPVLLNYAGVALYELWSLDAARVLFQAARRLDAALPHLKRNLEECDLRRRAAARERRSMRALHPAVPGLAGRARRIAARAQAVTGLKLSLCMIVRDEEEMLPRCLAAAAPAVDEIVIVDTGSRDRTIEIAESFGARVIEREWTGSFADARNASFDAATGDWVMYLDADEVLVAEDVPRLRGLLGRVWREAFYLVETSYTGDAGDGSAATNSALRIFRNRPEYRFEGRLHEQIAHNLPAYAPGRIEQTSLRVEHYGYLGVVRDAKEKSRRNIELLRAQQAETAPTAFLHFNLGTEHLAAGDPGAAVEEFERAWKMMTEAGEHERDWAPPLAARLAAALRQAGRAGASIARIEEALALYPQFTDLVFARALACRELGDEAGAVASLEQCIAMGDAPARYGATIGSGTYLPRIALAEHHLRYGRLDPAHELLDWCLREHPGFIGSVGPYATLRLRSGATAASVIAELEQRLPALSPSVRFVVACTLHAHGAMDAAAEQYRHVLASRPQSAQTRAALAETLLHQRLYSEAAAEAAEIGDDDPFAALARRIELWGLIAAGELESARAIIGRGSESGLRPVELGLFEAWAALSAGEPAEHRLPLAAAPLLGVILETLLGAHDFEAFERLLPLFHRSELSPREQRETLASMYLRHGFLASAAQEWMAACESEPDARAFIGLARVALANGQQEDAAIFAGEAVGLDPDSELAVAIFERCRPQMAGSR